MQFTLKADIYGVGRFSHPQGDYVLPPGGGNPSYTATHYVSPTGTATWAQATNPLTPASADTALSAGGAVAGNHVQCVPGTELFATTDSRLLPAMLPANSGTVNNPIVFFAQNRAIDTANTALRTKLTTDATTGVANGCPVIGSNGRDYIVIDGFWIDEVDAVPTADTGPVVLHNCTGVKILGCVLDGTTPTGYDTWASAPTENHNGVRFQGASDCEIADNLIDGFKNPGNSHNGAGIMSYTSDGPLLNNRNNLIENNEISNCGAGIYIKGQFANTDQGSFTIRRNKIHTIQNQCIEFGGHNGPTSNVYQNIITDGNQGVMLGRDGVDNVVVVNNTLDNHTDASLWLKANLGTGCRFENNISINPGNAHITGDAGPVTADIIPDHNCYDQSIAVWYINSTAYNSFATYDTGSGAYEDNSINSDPGFVGGGDYSLDTGSPCLDTGDDILGLVGGGVINMGAVINIDTIGPRLAA